MRDAAALLKPSAMDRDRFIAAFGDLFEHTPQLAAATFEAGLNESHDTAEGLHHALVTTMRALPQTDKLALLRAHPDLAGKLALAKQMTAGSVDEQGSAGLDVLGADDLARFTQLNNAYKERFGFPFIMAVKGRGKAEILEAFETRLANPMIVEFEAALTQVERIVALRLADRL